MGPSPALPERSRRATVGPVGNYDDPELTQAPDRSRWWLPAVVVGVVMLVLGGVLGIAIGTSVGPDDPPARPVAAAPPAPPPAPAPAPAPPCLAAGQAGAALIEQIEQGVQAIAALDPGALRAVVDRLQPLQAQLQGAVDTCSGRIPQ